MDFLPAPEIATASKSFTDTGRTPRLGNQVTGLGTSRETSAGLLNKLPGIGPCKREDSTKHSQDQSCQKAAHASQDAYDREREDYGAPEMVLRGPRVEHDRA